MKRFSIFAVVLLLATTSLFAATVTANAAARIGKPLVITPGATLSFGTIFVTDPAGGAVTIGWDDVNSLLTATGDDGATPLTSTEGTYGTWVAAGDDPAIGTFTVNGPPAAPLTYAVTVGTGSLEFGGTLCPDGYSCAGMPFTTLVVGPSGVTGFGETSFKVGGTLTVAGTQGEGSYIGTYEITANFQ